MIQQLFKKPKDKSWTQLCIDIDREFYQPNADMDKMYSYIWLIAYMLICKAKYFSEQSDREDFATLLSYSTYTRMADTSKVPIKSVLNYMKSIISFRRMTYEAQKHQEILDQDFCPKFDPVEFSNEQKRMLERQNHHIVETEIYDLIERTPKLIKKHIPKVYRADKALFHNIYISCVLSLLNRLTIPSKLKAKHDSDLEQKPNYNSAGFYHKRVSGDLILWHLPKSFKSVIQVTLNKVYSKLTKEISEISTDGNISESEFNAMMASNFQTGGTSDEAGY